MTPVFQEEYGCSLEEGKARGWAGDCFRGALASLLDLPLHAVPHFAAMQEFEGKDFFLEAELWLRRRGLATILTRLPMADAVRHEIDADMYYIVGGPAGDDGQAHACVAQHGRIVHDPNPGKCGIHGTIEEWDHLFVLPIDQWRAFFEKLNKLRAILGGIKL